MREKRETDAEEEERGGMNEDVGRRGGWERGEERGIAQGKECHE